MSRKPQQSPVRKRAGELVAHPPTLDRQLLVSGKRCYWLLRRSQDVLLALIATVVLLPLLILVALIVWLDDPHGSPIFVQQRVGRNGKPFNMYKFRSMCVDAEQQLDGLLTQNQLEGPAFKLRDDPRITRVGRFLRASSIDELPQLLNVIKGDMSIVGPRPAVQYEVDLYDTATRQRLMVTPGMTCYWQIQPDRYELPFDERIALDLLYITERSFLVDWQITLGTFKAVFSMQGQ